MVLILYQLQRDSRRSVSSSPSIDAGMSVSLLVGEEHGPSKCPCRCGIADCASPCNGMLIAERVRKVAEKYGIQISRTGYEENIH